jgi:hypothetical protein
MKVPVYETWGTVAVRVGAMREALTTVLEGALTMGGGDRWAWLSARTLAALVQAEELAVAWSALDVPEEAVGKTYAGRLSINVVLLDEGEQWPSTLGAGAPAAQPDGEHGRSVLGAPVEVEAERTFVAGVAEWVSVRDAFDKARRIIHAPHGCDLYQLDRTLDAARRALVQMARPATPMADAGAPEAASPSKDAASPVRPDPHYADQLEAAARRGENVEWRRKDCCVPSAAAAVQRRWGGTVAPFNGTIVICGAELEPRAYDEGGTYGCTRASHHEAHMHVAHDEWGDVVAVWSEPKPQQPDAA